MRKEAILLKTAIIFYSYTGHTKRLAQELAGKENADLIEVKDKRRPGAIKAYTAGCLAALRGKKAGIGPVAGDLNAYDKIVVMGPVWAGNPAPPVNTIIDMLPSGKEVELHMVSASGGSRAESRLTARLREKGCGPVRYRNIKG